MKHVLLLAAVLTLGSSCADPSPALEHRIQPLSSPTFFKFPPQKNKTDPGTWGVNLTDIENHLPASYGSQYYHQNPAIHGHETTHGINAHLRNTFGKPGDNGFYVLKDRAIILAEPSMKKSQVAAHVPQSLRGSRFSLYITGQTAWDNEPLYIFDEWVAYTNDSFVGVELAKAGKWTYGWTDGVAGTLEFCAYATATALAIEKNDPGYFTKTPQFLEFFAWQLQRAMDIFREGKDLKDFTYDKQDQFYQTLQTASDAAPLRTFISKRFGSTFMQQVLGLAPSPPPTPDSGASPPPPRLDGGGAPPPPGADTGVGPLQPDTGAPQPPNDAGSDPSSDSGVIPLRPPGSPSAPGEVPLVGGCSAAPGSTPSRGALLWVLTLLSLWFRGRGGPSVA
jgi:hypothetical protein